MKILTFDFIYKFYSILVTLMIMSGNSNSNIFISSTCGLSIETCEDQQERKNVISEASLRGCKKTNFESDVKNCDTKTMVTEKEKDFVNDKEEGFVSSAELSESSTSGSTKGDCHFLYNREKDIIPSSSDTSLSELSPCEGLTKENCQILYDREKYMQEGSKKELEENLVHFMNEVLKRMKEIEPVIGYIEKKIHEYQKSRKYDKVSLVGSLGNKLYFPELMPDGSYQVESDILYERSFELLSIPVYNEDSLPKPVTADVEVDTLNETLPHGTVLLKVKDIDGELDETDRHTFFQKIDESENIYFKSDVFRMYVPHMHSTSILGEKEINTFAAPILQPLYRTFKTHRKILTTKEREITFVILMDKVASIKVPWQSIADKFKTRKRVWPPEEIVKKVVSEGCSLIHKSANGFKSYMLEWRLTFALSEQLIVSRFTDQQRALFVLIKQIKRKYLDMGTFESGEAKMGLTTYHLKTVMLWLSELVSPENWSQSPLECFISFLKHLEKCLQDNFLAHYFIPDINIFEGAWSHKHLQWDESKWLSKNKPMRLLLLEKIQEIIQHPETYLVQDILWATDEKHAHEREKIPVVENFFGDLLHSVTDKELGVRNELNLDVEKIRDLVKSLNEEDENKMEDNSNEQNEKVYDQAQKEVGK